MPSSGRISKQLPILLIGDDLDGKVFSERTKTVVLSLHGAGILSKHKLSPEQELILRCPERNQEAEIRVVGQIGTHNGVHTYGVAFVDPNLNFWGLEFPPLSPLEREMGILSVFCTSCKTLEKIDDTSIEADICATGEGVMRFCRRCGSSTLWKTASAAAPQESVSAASGQMSLFPSSALPASPPAATAAPAPPESRDSAPTLTPSSGSSVPPGSVPAGTSGYYASLPEQFPEPGTAVLTLDPPERRSCPRVDRRKHPRVKVSYSACVRHPQRGDDVVLCEDMSRGGVRFKSRKRYYPQSLIEIAVPYQPGQPAIFVPAQIVYVEELPEQQLYRYGVQYLKPTRVRDAF